MAAEFADESRCRAAILGGRKHCDVMKLYPLDWVAMYGSIKRMPDDLLPGGGGSQNRVMVTPDLPTFKLLFRYIDSLLYHIIFFYIDYYILYRASYCFYHFISFLTHHIYIYIFYIMFYFIKYIILYHTMFIMRYYVLLYHIYFTYIHIFTLPPPPCAVLLVYFIVLHYILHTISQISLKKTYNVYIPIPFHVPFRDTGVQVLIWQGGAEAPPKEAGFGTC